MSNLSKFLLLLFIGLVLAAVCIWFIGGKKQEFDTTATLNVQPSQVFPYVVDPELKKKWMTGLVEHEVIDSSKIDELTQLRTVLEANGQTIDFDDLVIRFTENEIITIKSRSKPMMLTSFFQAERDRQQDGADLSAHHSL